MENRVIWPNQKSLLIILNCFLGLVLVAQGNSHSIVIMKVIGISLKSESIFGFGQVGMALVELLYR